MVHAKIAAKKIGIDGEAMMGWEAAANGLRNFSAASTRVIRSGMGPKMSVPHPSGRTGFAAGPRPK